MFVPAVLIQAVPWADERPWKRALVHTLGPSWQASVAALQASNGC
jgi:hypothetical protein